MGCLFPFLHSRARGNRAPGKWPRDGLRIVDRLRSQSECNGAGGGGRRAEVGRSFDQPGQVQAAGHWLPGPALLLGLLTGPSPLQSLSRAGVGASVRVTATPVRVSSPGLSRSEVLSRH